MLHGRWRKLATAFVLSASLLTTASCASNESQLSLSQWRLALTGQSSATLTEAEKAEIQAAIRSTYPKFPRPELGAIQRLRELNDPALNRWVQDLAVLCRQLEPEECQ